MNGALAHPASGSADYRRQARRIRASFAGNSFLTQQALHTLAKNRDIELRNTQPVVAQSRLLNSSRLGKPGSSAYLRTGVADAPMSPLQSGIAAVVERGFAEHAASKLQPFGFTFSDRVALLDTAENLGITRFRANLILAMQENRAATRSPGRPVVFSKSISWFLLVLGIEILIVLALVWAFTR